MFRSTPGGRACVVTAGLGMRSDFCALRHAAPLGQQPPREPGPGPDARGRRPGRQEAAPRRSFGRGELGFPSLGEASLGRASLSEAGPRLGGTGHRIVGDRTGHRPGGRPRQGDQQVEHCHRGGGRGQGGQQAGDRRVRPRRRRGQPDRREHRDAGHAVGHPPGGRRADQGRERAQHDHDPGDQDELVVRAELGDGEVLQPWRREVDLQLADHHHRRPAGPGQPGHELPHAQRHARGQHPRDGAESRAPRVQAPHPAQGHDVYSARSPRRFGRLAKICRQSADRRCYEY